MPRKNRSSRSLVRSMLSLCLILSVAGTAKASNGYAQELEAPLSHAGETDRQRASRLAELHLDNFSATVTSLWEVESIVSEALLQLNLLRGHLLAEDPPREMRKDFFAMAQKIEQYVEGTERLLQERQELESRFLQLADSYQRYVYPPSFLSKIIVLIAEQNAVLNEKKGLSDFDQLRDRRWSTQLRTRESFFEYVGQMKALKEKRRSYFLHESTFGEAGIFVIRPQSGPSPGSSPSANDKDFKNFIRESHWLQVRGRAKHLQKKGQSLVTQLTKPSPIIKQTEDLLLFCQRLLIR